MSIMVKIQLLECSRSGFQTVLRVEIDLWPVIDDIHQKGLKRLHIFFDIHLQLAFLLNLSLQAHSWVKTRGLRCMPLQFMHLHETLPTKHSGSRITLLLKVHNDYYYVKPIMAPHSDSVQQESPCMWEKVSKWVLVPPGSIIPLLLVLNKPHGVSIKVWSLAVLHICCEMTEISCETKGFTLFFSDVTGLIWNLCH
jgi:hypothetical protein